MKEAGRYQSWGNRGAGLQPRPSPSAALCPTGSSRKATRANGSYDGHMLLRTSHSPIGQNLPSERGPTQTIRDEGGKTEPSDGQRVHIQWQQQQLSKSHIILDVTKQGVEWQRV